MNSSPILYKDAISRSRGAIAQGGGEGTALDLIGNIDRNRLNSYKNKSIAAHQLSEILMNCHNSFLMMITSEDKGTF